MYYMNITYPFFGVKAPLWFGITPISAGIFGIPLGILTIIVVSLLTPAPDRKTQELIEHVRYPHLKGSTW
jgi:cation/acetate symporter